MNSHLSEQLDKLDAIEKRTLRKKTPKRCDSLKVLTYNTWIDGHSIEDRIARIIDQIKTHKPDAICLQEVRSDVFKIIESSLSDRYHVFQGFEKKVIGVVLMIHRKHTYLDKYYYDYPETDEFGQIIGCSIQLNGLKRPIHVLGTQFDSGNQRNKIRVGQYQTLLEVIRTQKCANVIVMVDTAITRDNDHETPEELESELRKSELSDCWNEMKCPNICKYTIDYHNQNISEKVLLRADRILYKLKHGAFPQSISLIGVERSPSTHYGVLAEIALGKK